MTVKTVLRNKPNKDGSYTIRIRVTENRKSRFIATGEKIHKSYWDDKNGTVKENFPDSNRINSKIDSLKPSLTAKKVMLGDFLAYWDTFINQVEATKSIGETNKHRTSKNIFMKFMGEQFGFNDVTHEKTKEYIFKLYSHYDNRNTAYSYLKKFRRVVNEALADDKILIDPFLRIPRMEAQPTESKALSAEQLNDFKSLPVYPQQKKYKDTWLALFYLRGCRIGDLLRLKFKNIEGEFIVYYMHKTNVKMTIKIQSPLYKKILGLNKDRFDDVSLLPSVSDEFNLKSFVTNHPEEYIFPYLKDGIDNVPRVVKRGQMKGENISAKLAEYKSVCSYTALINKNLKEISRLLGTKITTHSARHSYSTWLKTKTNDVYKIMHMLGHSSVVVTERYLASLPKYELYKLDDMYDSELSEEVIDDVVQIDEKLLKSMDLKFSKS